MLLFGDVDRPNRLAAGAIITWWLLQDGAPGSIANEVAL